MSCNHDEAWNYPWVEEFLYHLSGDDPQQAEEFFRSHAGERELFLKIRGRFMETDARLKKWGEERHPPGTAAEEPLPADSTAPHGSIPGHRLIREIGRGGMGIVYHALELATNRPVALKVIPSGSDKNTQERFQREINAIARARSQNIVTLYQVGSSNGNFYYSMELLKGETLEKKIGRWKSSPSPDRFREVAAILIDICSAADQIHAEGIIHRDLKPSNIFVTEKRIAKLIDFGLARHLADPTMTRTGAVFGTVAYMSPEQILGKRSTIDRRSDVYGLGVTLYEAAALKRPFESEGKEELMTRIFAVDPEPPSAVDPGVPEDLSAVIQKAMEFEPFRRYPTAGDLVADLRAFLASEPVSARPIGRWGRLERRLRRRKRQIAAALFILLAILGGGLAVSLLLKRWEIEQDVQKALEASRRAAGEFRALRSAIPEAEKRLEEIRKQFTEQDEYTARLPIFQAERELADLEKRAEERFNLAVFAAQRGLEIQAKNRELRDGLNGLLWARFLEEERQGNEDGKKRFETLLLGHAREFRDRLRAKGTFSIASDPPGAQVYLFRYEPVGLLLMPVPYHPGKGFLRNPAELPQSIMKIFSDPFFCQTLQKLDLKSGDRIITIDNLPVSLAGNRDFSLNHLPIRNVRLQLERDGERFERCLSTGNDTFPNCGRFPTMACLNECVETDVFPLSFLDGGALDADAAEFQVAAGSYLAVLRLSGYRDTRLPFLIVRDCRLHLVVHLYTDAEIGESFLHVPAGPAILGGDPSSFYPQPLRTVEIKDFFISRYEVSCREYFEFLNDPGLRKEIEADMQAEDPILLPVDLNGNESDPKWIRRPDGSIAYVDAGYPAEPPIRWLPRPGAERYVRWMNDREKARGGRRTFALPSADELEKAARGADGRLFPWGNQFDWSLLCTYRTHAPTRGLRYATDASPYNVRNLAGLMAEWTRDDVTPLWIAEHNRQKLMECRIKGGSYQDYLEPHFHPAGHTLERVRRSSSRIGFRLVAYPPDR
ncbi:MAG: protein kinase [Planctomycetes bacterium]|nr:protein kinase [Planctomycetota bacterium]